MDEAGESSKPPADRAERKKRLKAYNEVVGVAELATIDLVSCTFEVKDEYPGAMTDARNGGTPLEFVFGGQPGEVQFDPEQGLALCVFDWSVSVRAGETVLLRLSALFRVIYTSLQNQDPDAVATFVRRVGKFAAFPYFRTFAGQISWLSNTELPTLPVLRE